MPGAPVTNWVVVAFLLSVATMLGFNPGTRVALYVAPLWFGLLGIAYYARVFRKTTLIHPGNGCCARSDLSLVQLVMAIGETTFARSVLAF